MIQEIIKALLVGVIAAVPIGPIFVMAVQRTLCHGRRTGRMVGLGAAAGDMLYAGAGLLTLGLVKDFVLGHQAVFLLAGSLILAVIGVGMFSREVSLPQTGVKRQVSGRVCALEAFTGTLSNPAALATMLALLTAFGLGGGRSAVPAWLLAPLVGAGEFLYWSLVTFLLARFLRIDEKVLRTVSRAAGVLVCLFAGVLLVRGILMLIGN